MNIPNGLVNKNSRKIEQRLMMYQRWIQRLATYLLIACASLSFGFLNNSPAHALPFQQNGLEDNFVTAAVDKAESAVVQVNVSRALAGTRDIPGALRPFLGGGQPAPSNAPVLRGIGSGFVIDSNGLLLTNAHVVNEADTVTVSFQDGRI